MIFSCYSLIMSMTKFRPPTNLKAKMFIYAWFRYDDCLYVGMTTNGFKRFKDHPYINDWSVQIDDVLRIWLVNNPANLHFIEQVYINMFKPKLNIQVKKIQFPKNIQLFSDFRIVASEPPPGYVESLKCTWPLVKRKQIKMENFD